MKTKINVHGVRCYGYHGCMRQEEIIGTWFTANVEVTYNFLKSAETDDLSDTLDYSLVAQIVQEEVAKRSKLIEQVALRIFKRIEEIEGVEGLKLELFKEQPPIDGRVESVSVSIES